MNKLTVAYLIYKFPTFYAIKKVITMFKSAIQMNPIWTKMNLVCFLKIHFNIFLACQMVSCSYFGDHHHMDFSVSSCVPRALCVLASSI
jgi:hypothetical protein